MNNTLLSKCGDFIKEMKRDYMAVTRKTSIKMAEALSEMTGVVFDSASYPSYFFGRMDAPVVVLTLNPKYGDKAGNSEPCEYKRQSFDNYLDYYTNYGQIVWEGEDDRYRKGAKRYFESRKVRFFREYDIHGIGNGKNHKVTNEDIVKISGSMLQLELIPYGSSKFIIDYEAADDDLRKYLEERVENILDVIAASRRTKIIMLSKIYADILGGRLYDREECNARLRTNAGGWSSRQVSCVNAKLRIGKRDYSVALLPSYYGYSTNISEYGKFCRNPYLYVRKEVE
jgi:hypothetical protein